MTHLIPMELSEEEQRIILERRAEEAHRQATTDFRIKAFKVAHEFAEWTIQNDYYSPTFSTFVNQFCYEEDDLKIMFDAVKRIWDLVHTFELPKEKPQC